MDTPDLVSVIVSVLALVVAALAYCNARISVRRQLPDLSFRLLHARSLEGRPYVYVSIHNQSPSLYAENVWVNVQAYRTRFFRMRGKRISIADWQVEKLAPDGWVESKDGAVHIEIDEVARSLGLLLDLSGSIYEDESWLAWQGSLLRRILRELASLLNVEGLTEGWRAKIGQWYRRSRSWHPANPNVWRFFLRLEVGWEPGVREPEAERERETYEVRPILQVGIHPAFEFFVETGTARPEEQPKRALVTGWELRRSGEKWQRLS